MEAKTKRIPLWRRSLASAFRGGKAGFLAMILQVVLLMWVRTVLAYQSRFNLGFSETFSILWAEGGIWRFYQGFWFALLVAPLVRFGDTAANEGVKEFFSHRKIPIELATLLASLVAGAWRIFLTPVDNLKTNLQVSGADGIAKVLGKVTNFGIATLWDGALGIWLASIVGYYPWFVVNNKLEQIIPAADGNNATTKQIRRAFIGLCCSVAKDLCSNGIRVIKIYKQTSDLTYTEALAAILEESGVLGLLFRGLGTKLIANGISSIIFSIIWKRLMDKPACSSSPTEHLPTQGTHQADKHASSFSRCGRFCIATVLSLVLSFMATSSKIFNITLTRTSFDQSS